MNAPARNTLARPLAIALVGLSVFAVAAAIYVTGSPMQQRRERIDERRVEALMTLAREAHAHARARNGRLPASLDALERPGLRLERRDPVTGTPYEYRVLDAKTFELCATFESDTAQRSPRGVESQWAHGVGRQCFRRRMGDKALEVATAG